MPDGRCGRRDAQHAVGSGQPSDSCSHCVALRHSSPRVRVQGGLGLQRSLAEHAFQVRPISQTRQQAPGSSSPVLGWGLGVTDCTGEKQASMGAACLARAGAPGLWGVRVTARGASGSRNWVKGRAGSQPAEPGEEGAASGFYSVTVSRGA